MLSITQYTEKEARKQQNEDIVTLMFDYRHLERRRKWHFGSAPHRRFSASSSSRVRGQSAPSRRERLRSASTLPPVWHCAQ